MKSLLLSILLLLPGGLAEGQNSFIPGTEITAETVLAGMNFYRTLHGQNPLRLDPRLSAAADGRIQDMEERGYWSHASPDGGGPFLRLRDHGYAHAAAGENLASGFETAGVLVSSWMESEGHRRNILSPDFSDAGIAIIDGAIGRRAAGRSVVVLFGREALPAPPHGSEFWVLGSGTQTNGCIPEPRTVRMGGCAELRTRVSPRTQNRADGRVCTTQNPGESQNPEPCGWADVQNSEPG